MIRLSTDLAHELLRKAKIPEIAKDGNNAFTLQSTNGIGIIDPVCALGLDFKYIIECPISVIYPEMEGVIKPDVNGYFLYKNSELQPLMQPWDIVRSLIDPLAGDNNELIDVSDCSVTIPNAVDKLTISVRKQVNTLEEVIQIYPDILDCLR